MSNQKQNVLPCLRFLSSPERYHPTRRQTGAASICSLVFCPVLLLVANSEENRKQSSCLRDSGTINSTTWERCGGKSSVSTLMKMWHKLSGNKFFVAGRFTVWFKPMSDDRNSTNRAARVQPKLRYVSVLFWWPSYVSPPQDDKYVLNLERCGGDSGLASAWQEERWDYHMNSLSECTGVCVCVCVCVCFVNFHSYTNKWKNVHLCAFLCKYTWCMPFGWRLCKIEI